MKLYEGPRGGTYFLSGGQKVYVSGEMSGGLGSKTVRIIHILASLKNVYGDIPYDHFLLDKACAWFTQLTGQSIHKSEKNLIAAYQQYPWSPQQKQEFKSAIANLYTHYQQIMSYRSARR